MTDLSNLVYDDTTNGTGISYTGTTITKTQVRVTYPREQDKPIGTAFHDADSYQIDDHNILHIFSGGSRIASYLTWLTVDIITTTTTAPNPAFRPLAPFIRPLDNPFWPTPFTSPSPIIGPTCR